MLIWCCAVCYKMKCSMPEIKVDFPAFSGDYCLTSTNRGFGRQPTMGSNCEPDHSWLKIGIDLKLLEGDLGEIPGTMEQRLSLCSRGNSKPGDRPAVRAYTRNYVNYRYYNI